MLNKFKFLHTRHSGNKITWCLHFTFSPLDPLSPLTPSAPYGTNQKCSMTTFHIEIKLNKVNTI
jgi:hypothetical protein